MARKPMKSGESAPKSQTIDGIRFGAAPAPQTLQRSGVRIHSVDFFFANTKMPAVPQVERMVEMYSVVGPDNNVLPGTAGQRAPRESIVGARPSELQREINPAHPVSPETVTALQTLAGAIAQRIFASVAGTVVSGGASYTDIWVEMPMTLQVTYNPDWTPNLPGSFLGINYTKRTPQGLSLGVPFTDRRPLGDTGWNVDMALVGQVVTLELAAIKVEEGIP